MKNVKDFYEILGVEKTANEEEIKKKYKKVSNTSLPSNFRWFFFLARFEVPSWQKSRTGVRRNF